MQLTHTGKLALIQVPDGYPAHLSLTVGIKDIPRNIDIPGIVHLYEHMMFKGCKKLSEKKLLGLLSQTFGDYNAYTSGNKINLNGYSLNDNDRALLSKDGIMDDFVLYDKDSEASILMQNMLFYPDLRVKDLEEERRVVIREINEKTGYEKSLVDLECILFQKLGINYVNELGTAESVSSITVNHLKCLRDAFNDPGNTEVIWTQTYSNRIEGLVADDLRHNPVYVSVPSFTVETEINYENDMVIFLWNINHVTNYEDLANITLFRHYAMSEVRTDSLFNILRRKGYVYYFSVIPTVVEGRIFLIIEVETSKGRGRDLLKEIEDWNNRIFDSCNEEVAGNLWESVKFREAKSSFDVECGLLNTIAVYGEGVSLDKGAMVKDSPSMNLFNIKKMMGKIPTYSIVGLAK